MGKYRIIKASSNNLVKEESFEGDNKIPTMKTKFPIIRETTTFHIEKKGLFGWYRIKQSIGSKTSEYFFNKYEECEEALFKTFFRTHGEVIQIGNLYKYKEYSYSI